MNNGNYTTITKKLQSKVKTNLTPAKIVKTVFLKVTNTIRKKTPILTKKNFPINDGSITIPPNKS